MSEKNTAEPKSKQNEKTETPIAAGKGAEDLASKLRSEDPEEPGSTSTSNYSSRRSSVSGSFKGTKKHRSREKQSSFKEMVSKDATYSKYITGEDASMEMAAHRARRKHKFKYEVEDPVLKEFAGVERRRHTELHGSNVPRPSTTPSDNLMPHERKILSSIMESNIQSASGGMQLSKDPVIQTIPVPEALQPFPAATKSAPTTFPRKVSDHITKRLDKVPKSLKFIYSRRPVNPPLRYAKLTQQRAKRLFGNDSRLATQQFHVVLRMLRKESESGRSQSLDSGSTHGSALTWIQEYSEGDFIVHPDYGDDMPSSLRRLATSRLFAAFAPLYYGMILTGRWPFSGGISNKTGFLNITLNHRSSRFVTFVLTSLLIFIMMTLSLTSTVLSYEAFATNLTKDKIRGSKNGTVHPYVQLEVLLLEKHWLSYTMLMLIFLYGTVCNVILMFNGDKVAKMLNDVVNTCVTLQLDGSKYIWVGCVVSLVLPSLWILYKVAGFHWQYTVKEEELNGYLTMSTTRFFYRYIRTNLDVYHMVDPFILIIQIYGFISFWFHVALPAIISMGINNLGQHWNFRLAVLLDKIGVTSTSLKRIKSQLNYEYMLRCHLIIRDLVTYFSMDAFAAILILFYCLMVSGICVILFRIARLSGISFDRENQSLPELPNNTIEHVNIKYVEPPYAAIYDSSILLVVYVGALVIVNEILGRVGKTILDKGFFHVRRHGLLTCRTPHERRFILSLYQLLSPSSACTIAPGNLFSVDRRFLIAIIETIAILFTTMIQARVTALIQTEILGLCDTGICVIGYSSVKYGKANPLAELHMEAHQIFMRVYPPEIPVTTTTSNPFLPKPPAPFTDLAQPLFQRCLLTDISRQIIYRHNNMTNSFEPLVFSTESSDCLFKSYPALYDPTDTEIYFDAFGKPIERTTIDSCGIPSLPNIKYVKREGLSQAELEALMKTITLSVQETIYTQTDRAGRPGNTYMCQTPEVPPPDPDVAVFAVIGPPSPPPFIGERPVICGMPSLYVDSYCLARQKNWDFNEFNKHVRGVDVLAKHSSAAAVLALAAYPLCSAATYDTALRNLFNGNVGRANELGFVFKLDVPAPGVPANPNRIWLRQTVRVGLAYEGDTIPASAPRDPSTGYLYPRWVTARLKRGLKTIFMPYPYTSENHRRSGTYMYDCFAERLSSQGVFDDCGQLPFTIVRGGLTVKPNRSSVKAQSDSFRCWDHQLKDDIKCGVDVRYPNFQEIVQYVCDNWKNFLNTRAPGGFLNEYLDDA